jgi:hypothetical protein
MARYKHTDAEAGQGMFLSVNLKKQLLPGSFEHMLDELVGGKIDISVFDNNYKNDGTGATAIPPAALIKLIIYGYSKGNISSRSLWDLGMNNIVAKALTCDMEPHWTTTADFISHNGEKFKEAFVKALTYCAELGLIGGEPIIPDSNYKSRLGRTEKKRYETADFKYHEEGNYYECPAGKKLEYKGVSGPEWSRGKTYRAGVTDCRPCPCNGKCMGHKKSLHKNPEEGRY